ncbi:MAG: protein kinase [Verrucomicrobiota bacterium]
MNESNAIRICSGCDKPVPNDAPEGLCPECLMIEALATAPVPMPHPDQVSLPEVGDTFGGYHIQRELGRGGMGAVFEAEQIETGRRVALKLLNHQLDSPEARARFLREGRLAASINHPNSVYVFGTDEIEGIPIIIMELVAGGNLEDYVKTRGPLPAEEAVDAVLQLISGLEAADAIGILHRDIKPSNCFRDHEGTVKIGDFGLSISSEANADSRVTLDGTVFGTPSFASPEQLRGEELNARSDMYAIGATLYCLLTGHPPFKGKTIAQLVANVLEEAPISLSEARPDLPEELVRVIMRCLQKNPGDRYASYSQLAQALTPFNSDAPTPAPIYLRFSAYLIDAIILAPLGFCIALLALGEELFLVQTTPKSMLVYFLLTGGSLFLWVLYFGVSESRWGASVGKRICRLRVTEVGTQPLSPSFFKATARATFLTILPAIPVWAYFLIDPQNYIESATTLKGQIVGLVSYLILLLFFLKARRHNGYASFYDWLTKTRVIRQHIIPDRAPLPDLEGDTGLIDLEAKNEKVGPFYLLEEFDSPESKDGDDSSAWVLAYDARLLRKIWIHRLPSGAEPLPSSQRQIARPGRLRWIGGRRSAEENWDSYEAPSGRSLCSLKESGYSIQWNQVRQWINDLATELQAAEAENTLPETLSLDRVWITGDGRAKLLDFVAPGAAKLADASEPADDATSFIQQVADLAEAPLPLHASRFREEKLPSLESPARIAGEIKPLLGKPTLVTRSRRIALVAACLVFPLCATVISSVSMRMVVKWNQSQPEIMQLIVLLGARSVEIPDPSSNSKNSESTGDFVSIYIASEFRDFVEDPEQWNSSYAQTMIVGSDRRFVEKSLADHPSPSKAEINRARKALKPFIRSSKGMDKLFASSWLPFVIAATCLILYVGVPAILASLICRGGLAMFTCGVALARARDGKQASRGRAFWRSLVTWTPIYLAVLLGTSLNEHVSTPAACLLASLALLVLTAISLSLPGRGLQDRIAGTQLVPR